MGIADAQGRRLLAQNLLVCIFHEIYRWLWQTSRQWFWISLNAMLSAWGSPWTEEYKEWHPWIVRAISIVSRKGEKNGGNRFSFRQGCEGSVKLNFWGALQVMYDASGVRLQAGRQAEVYHMILCSSLWVEICELFAIKLTCFLSSSFPCELGHNLAFSLPSHDRFRLRSL
jgi:hypothetical protein